MSAPAARRLAPVLPLVARQTRAEYLKLWRIPANSVTSLALPVVFYIFIALGHTRQPIQGTTYGVYVLASMGAYAVSTVMVFSFGIGVANERGMRMDVLMRAMPLPPWVYLVAKALTGLAFCCLSLAVLFAFAEIAGGVHPPVGDLAALGLRLLAGSIVFLAAGFAIGYLSGPSASIAVTNVIFLPTAFASGLFIPRAALESHIAQASPYLPLYRFGDLAWQAVGVRTGESVTADVLYLAAYGVVFFALALWAYRREEARKFS